MTEFQTNSVEIPVNSQKVTQSLSFVTSSWTGACFAGLDIFFGF
jgi:hypothetical protein